MKKTIATIAMLAVLPSCATLVREKPRENVIEYQIQRSEQYKYEDGTIEVEQHMYMKKNPNFKRLWEKRNLRR